MRRYGTTAKRQLLTGQLALGLMSRSRSGVSGAPGVSTPSNTVAPVQSVNAIGMYPTGTVSTTTGTWTESPSSYTYQWQEDGVDIAGATANTYVLPVGKIGKTIRCMVTGVNAGGPGAPVYTTGSRLLWSPAALAGHIQWIDVSRDDMAVEVSGKCSQLTDLSGNGNHIGQATDANRGTRTLYAELNNLKAIRLPGPTSTGPYMTGLITYNGTTFTAITVYRYLSTTDSNSPVVNYTNSAESGTGTQSAQLAFRATTTTTWRPQIGGSTVGSATLAADTPASLMAMLTGTERVSSMNGAVNTTVAATPTMNWNRCALGSGQNAGSVSTVRFHGDVMEIYINSAALSAADQAKLQGYVAHKWSPVMVAALPAGHAHKAAPP